MDNEAIKSFLGGIHSVVHWSPRRNNVTQRDGDIRQGFVLIMLTSSVIYSLSLLCLVVAEREKLYIGFPVVKMSV